jgi:DNA-binding transcriptional LysR family regulator
LAFSHLGPAIARFLQEHPGIEMSLDLDDRFVDAATGGFDAVLRHGAIGDGRLIVRRLATSRRLLVAAPSYLAEHGKPTSLTELEGHTAILYANRSGDWRFAGVWLDCRAAASGAAGQQDRDARCRLAGLGLAMLPTFFLHQEIKTGALIEVDIGWPAEGAELFLTYPRDHGAASKIRVRDSLRRSFGDPPYWEQP